MGIMQTMRDVFGDFLIPLIIIALLIVGIVFFAWSGLLDFRPGEETDAGANFAESYLTSIDPEMVQFYNYGGILKPNSYTDPALTVTEIQDMLSYKDYATFCYDCTGCSGETCSNCNECDLNEEANRFVTCDACEEIDGEMYCEYCTDNQADTYFCENLKDAIRKNYVLDKEIEVIIFSRSETINADLIYNAISQCTAESIKITDSGKTEEICYFDPAIAEKAQLSIKPKAISLNQIGCESEDAPCFARKAEFDYTYSDNMLFSFIQDDYPNHDDVCPSNKNIELCKPIKTYFSETVTVTDPTGMGNDYSELVEDSECSTCKENWENNADSLESCYEDGSTMDQCMIYKTEENFADEDYITDEDDEKYISATMMFPNPGILDTVALNGGIGKFAQLYTFSTSAFEYDSCIFKNRINPAGHIRIVYPTPWEEGSVGHVKINIGNLRTDRQKNCEFNIYICDSTSFAETTDETSVEIYDFFRSFQPNIDISGEITDSSRYYNYYEFELDREYTTDEIIWAIKQGYDYWQANSLPYYYAASQDNFFEYGQWLSTDGLRPETTAAAFANINDGIAAEGWEVQEKSFTGGCSRLSGGGMRFIEGSTFSDSKKSIGYSCPSGICSGTLKIKIEFIKNSMPLTPGPLKPFIWVCSE